MDRCRKDSGRGNEQQGGQCPLIRRWVGEGVMKFTFGSGQKPLDGYTIKRGVGKGGFGEVYFAVSDGGKEVALKLIRGDGAVELRGIAQCLNLKHPNLVNLFDLRTDQDGNQWVVMEYVAGETAGEILMKHLTKAPDVSGLPFEYVPIVAKALAKNPAQRYPSMAEMTQAIEALHAPAPAAKKPAAAPKAPPLPAALAAPPG